MRRGRARPQADPLPSALLPLGDPFHPSNSFSVLSARLEVLDCSVLDAVALHCVLPGGNIVEHMQGGLVARRWLLTEMFFFQ